MERTPALRQASASTRASVSVSRQRSGIPTRTQRPERLLVQVHAGSLGVRGQATHGLTDQDVALGDLHGRTVGIRDDLHPIENQTDRSFGALQAGGRQLR